MNAPFPHPRKAVRFPRLSKAQKLLQAAADRAAALALAREIIADTKPGGGIGGTGNPDRLSFDAWRR